MARIMSAVGEELVAPQLDQGLVEAAKLLAGLIDTDAYVGEVYSLGYNEALVQIHDFHRRQVGGIPALSFLVATQGSVKVAIRPIRPRPTSRASATWRR